MKIKVEGNLSIKSQVKKLVDSVLKLMKKKGYTKPEFSVVVARYLGKPAIGTNKQLNLSALDIIATSLSQEKQEAVKDELQAFQGLLMWAQKLGLNFTILSGLLELSSEDRASRIKKSQKDIPEEQLDELLTKLDDLEDNLSKVDKLIEGNFPSELNPSLTLVLVEQLANLKFEQSHIPAKRLVRLQAKSSELLQKLFQSKGEQAVSISRNKARIDQELLKLFVEVEPEKEIRSKLIAWLFAEDAWDKLRDEKYLWTLLSRMSTVASRYCNTDWAFLPGKTNLFDLVVNSKWPEFLNEQEKLQNSSKAAKKLISYTVPEVSKSIIFDPFKVDWGLVNEIVSEFRDYQLQMYQNSLTTYSKTLQSLLKS